MHLLIETIDILQQNNLSEQDILWVGTRNGRYSTSWEEFCVLAYIDYNHNDYLGPKIQEALCVVGNNWWLEREYLDEYHKEYWTFHRIPFLAQDTLKLTSIKNDYWE